MPLFTWMLKAFLAELAIDLVLSAAKEAAARSENTLDDKAVEAVAKHRDTIVTALKSLP